MLIRAITGEGICVVDTVTNIRSARFCLPLSNKLNLSKLLFNHSLFPVRLLVVGRLFFALVFSRRDVCCIASNTNCVSSHIL